MIKEALTTAGLAFLAAAGCKGINQDDYRIEAGHAHNIYECGIVRYEGKLGFDEETGRMQYGILNSYTGENGVMHNDQHIVTAGTIEIEMGTCTLMIIDLNSRFIEYRAREKRQ